MKKDDKWAWPRRVENWRQLEAELRAMIGGLKTPYWGDKRPMCFPGTTLNYFREVDLIHMCSSLLCKQLNMVGSHTQGEESEGGFDGAQRMEREVLGWIASTLGGESGGVDGYFCGGGTEANEQGFWIGRQYLRRNRLISETEMKDGIKPGIVVFTTPLPHYSLIKAVELLDIGSHTKERNGGSLGFTLDPFGDGLFFVEMSRDKNGECTGEMSVEALQAAFERKYLQGYRRFIVAPTVGTSLMGSIDPVEAISNFIEARETDTDARFYLHVDASFAGFTVPFVAPEHKFGFNVSKVMSMTLDGDKMGQLPYPAGVFLCRKGLMKYVERRADYVAGHRDDTISGSRSALAPVLAWYLYQKNGFDGQREYVQKCLDERDFLVARVREELPWVKILPCSPWVNFAPMEIPLDPGLGAIPSDILTGTLLGNYQLRSGKLPESASQPNGKARTIYKICVMPHLLEKDHWWIRVFVSSLRKAKEEFDARLK